VAFSKYSQGIINYAGDIAGPLNAELHIVHVINARDLDAVTKISSFGYKVDSDEYIKTIKEERDIEIKGLTKNLAVSADKLLFDYILGDPTSELLRYVVEKKMDLVVMGIKAKDIRHVFAGSVAERMFRKCPVPVLSFRGGDIAERMEKRVYKHIINA
jgi:nucleotide-binding universal stress UspA family protein